MLIVFGGLPGTGKTTISRALAARLRAVYLRIDAVEQALRESGELSGEVGAAGYLAAMALARSNLEIGHTVIADCVNPVPESREGWVTAARTAGARLLQVEVICSDVAEHRRRVEEREADIVGHLQPDWEAVQARDYRPWPDADVVIDTARLPPEAAVAGLERLALQDGPL
ncbi:MULTISPECIES: AAA family ATPase [Oceanibaculum]|uniref:Putative kinase n=1 Tax=Oceanibaculum indicum TaxID=526216 RepID=A0A420WI09_9PROT|nr:MULTISPECIES: AAA family ATPase [Oceanibaculum]MCH2394624.1 AAA family ATPase [Oceanibaculum sp.]RKQ70607.1 putative kinase [Oceanibaculum indicum]